MPPQLERRGTLRNVLALSWVRIVLVVLAVAVVANLVSYELKVTEQTEARPALRRELRAQVGGLIAEVHKREGDTVNEGEVVARLDQREVRGRRAVLLAQRDRVTAELAKLRDGNRPQEIERAQQVVRKAQALLALANAELKREQTLLARGVATKEAFQAAKYGQEVRGRELAHARADLALLNAGFREEEVRAKEAERAEIEAQLVFAEEELALGEIRSPIHGTLTTPHFHEFVGRAVEPGDLIAEIADFDRMRIEVLVPERELDAVEPGDTVVMKARAFPEREFRGEVEFVPSVAMDDELTQQRVVRVVAHVDNPGHLLTDKSTGWAEIHCGRRSILYLGVRRALRWIRVRFVV